jgi:hypothetical protein
MTEAVRWTGEGVELLRGYGSVEAQLSAMSIHAHMLTLDWRGPDARAVIAEALELAGGLPDQRVRDQLEGTIAFAAVVEENWEEAELRLQEIMARPVRTDFAARAAPSYLADVAYGRGDFETALGRCLHALDGQIAISDLNNVVLQLVGITASLTALHRDEEAARLIGAMERLADEIGMPRATISQTGAHGEPLRVLPERLGPTRYDRLRAEGRRLDLDQTVALAHELAGVPAS